jgi:general secretion pathway protein I
LSSRRGFTLLEVMVSLGILAISLASISGITAGSYAASEYGRGVTVATLLARSKMIDVEEEMWKDGFPDDDKELDGEFDEEGHPEYRWKATVRKIDVDIGQLLGSLLGGDVSQENMGDHIQGYLGALTGGVPEGIDSGAAEQVGGSQIADMLKGQQLDVLFKQVGENLAKAIREIELEILWGKEGVAEESVKFVQYIVTTGRINTPTNVRSSNPAALGNRNANTLRPPGGGGGATPPPLGRSSVPLGGLNNLLSPGTTAKGVKN